MKRFFSATSGLVLLCGALLSSCSSSTGSSASSSSGGQAGAAGSAGQASAGTVGSAGVAGASGSAGDAAGNSGSTGTSGDGGASGSSGGASGSSAGASGGASGSDSGSGGAAGSTAGAGGAGPTIQPGCATPAPGCYTVYAHTADTLYYLDQTTKSLVTVGAFLAPLPLLPIADLAVTPDNQIWVISATTLYSASPTDGHVTRVGDITSCGKSNVALAADRAGQLYVGDFAGAICTLDRTTSPPTVGPPVTLGADYALVGDFAVVGDGTTFGTVSLLSATPPAPNFLATIDLTSGVVTAHATSTGFPKLFGVAYAGGKVLAFSADGSGDAIAIDPATGVGTLYAPLSDPTTHAPVAIEGAGVNPLVTP